MVFASCLRCHGLTAVTEPSADSAPLSRDSAFSSAKIVLLGWNGGAEAFPAVVIVRLGHRYASTVAILRLRALIRLTPAQMDRVCDFSCVSAPLQVRSLA